VSEEYTKLIRRIDCQILPHEHLLSVAFNISTGSQPVCPEYGARREGATTTPPTATFQATAAEPVPGLDAEGTVLVDEVVAGKRTKDKKGKRKDVDAVEKERAEAYDGAADPQGERRERRKKRKVE
jgi:hypothetical protein